ncbi:MAG: SEC-C metal-binding domain-containing protein [Deltaproteobacteria bacterium]|nr:SEC-C metal-binding domain-containing protein [Deltaproteobacteria bacterium]
MEAKENTSFFSDVCVKQCKGMCCDPWWGIISYTAVKEGGLSNLKGFRDEIIKGIKAREERILKTYVTNEVPLRPLFKSPEKYNVSIKDIKANGTALSLNILAIFAFRCLFLSPDKSCSIHPSLLFGTEIRPPHCGYLGVLSARPGEKGYCRIIDAAKEDPDGSKVKRAIELEKETGRKHYNGGVDTVEEAADRVIGQLKDYCSKNLASFNPQLSSPAPGRNDPCYCGSGNKYKKCHGR